MDPYCKIYLNPTILRGNLIFQYNQQLRSGEFKQVFEVIKQFYGHIVKDKANLLREIGFNMQSPDSIWLDYSEVRFFLFLFPIKVCCSRLVSCAFSCLETKRFF